MKRSDLASSNEPIEIEGHIHKLFPQLICKGTKVVPKVLDDDDYDIRIHLEYNVVQLPEDLKSVEQDYMLLLQTNPVDSSECKNTFQKQCTSSCDNPYDDSDTYRRRRLVRKTKRNSVYPNNE